MTPQEELIKKIFKKFLDEYLRNVIKELPQSYRAQQMKAGGILAQAVIVFETKFLKEPFKRAIRTFLKDYDLVKKEQLEKLSKKLDVLKKDLEDYKDLRALLDKTHVLVKKGDIPTKKEIYHYTIEAFGHYNHRGKCDICRRIEEKLKSLGGRE